MRECIKEEISRSATGAPCKCGGYGDETGTRVTKEEVEAYDCGRSYSCCTDVFKCRICGTEFIAVREAPDFDA